MFEFLPGPSVGSVAVRPTWVGDGVLQGVIFNGVSGPERGLREKQSRSGVIQAAQLGWSPHGLLRVRLAQAGCLTLHTSR